VGSTGSGKTTYSRAIAAVLDAPHFELDATYHQPNWTPIEPDEFRARVHEMVRAEKWTVDGNYRAVRPELIARADIVFAIDLPRAVIMRQLVIRTWRRGWRREELWNGNRESLRNFLRWSPEKSIVRWGWTQYDTIQQRLNWLEQLSRGYGISFVRVRSHDEAREQLIALVGTRIEPFLR
jgi:adenylate kinase family enzyme